LHPELQKSDTWTIRVGLASCGIAAGGKKVFEAFRTALDSRDIKTVKLQTTGCMGMCYNEVLVEVIQPDGKNTYYKKVIPEHAAIIIDRHIIQGNAVTELGIPGEELNSVLAKQKRIVLRNCGIVDPESIEDYISHNGYQAIAKVLDFMTPEDVIEEITSSGLRGRGGAGFSTGIKWGLARKSPGFQKYLVCNADEGDPGAFMDRSVLESDPHSVIEGMLIGAYTIGATEGFIYVRAEYPLAVQRLEVALSQARAEGLLGEGIMGHNFDFHLSLRQGAGAFVCGEETALIMSIEGKRGMPRTRPPFPAQSGLWDKPTNINNVETFANIPWIVLNGATAYSSYGVGRSKGTKVFALAGKIQRSGLIEVPMGISLKEIVFDIGNGTSSGLEFKAIQIGGPSGGVIPASMSDITVDYESVNATGAIMGSGGLIVMDETDCMVDVAKFFLNFIQDESCGKCTFCRVGTLRMQETLNRITSGKGNDNDLKLLEELAQGIKSASLCGLGQSAPNPVLTTMRYFREEYEKHIAEKKCPAKKCQALITYKILEDKCRGCTLCTKYCPAGAISGNKKEPHFIDPSKCIRCGLCMSTCRLGAITVF
jgi:NADH-quinone oxidoreductase subunit F